MLCPVCIRMLRGRRGQVFEGTLDPHFVHHDTAKSFWASASIDCSICHVLGDELGAKISEQAQIAKIPGDQGVTGLRSMANLSAVPSVGEKNGPNT